MIGAYKNNIGRRFCGIYPQFSGGSPWGRPSGRPLGHTSNRTAETALRFFRRLTVGEGAFAGIFGAGVFELLQDLFRALTLCLG